MAETRRWALEARSARLHKPHYLDARNPFLLQVLARQLAESGDGGTVTFVECLPRAEDYDGQDGRSASAEEFFVELTLTTAGHPGHPAHPAHLAHSGHPHTRGDDDHAHG